jgi:hypothetical protein
LVTDLPPWSQKTQSLSICTAEVRRVLLHADDPHKALFVDLPAIFGEDDGEAAANGIEAALRELNDAYPQMLRDLSRKMLNALGHADDDDYITLRERGVTVADLTGDLRVDAFATRLSTFDGQVSDVEGIASFAINRPLREWTDRDPDQAALALAEFALKFRRAEALVRVKGRNPTREAIALVIGTGEAGEEMAVEFEVAARDRPRIAALAEALGKVLAQSRAERNIVLAALAATGVQTIGGSTRRLRKAG